MRIGFLISDQHFGVCGGIGQFAKSFCEMAIRQGWVVDFIVDKPIRKREGSLEDTFEAHQFFYPTKPLSYGTHASYFQFGDSINQEKIINFRDSAVNALTHNIYNVFVVNTPEGLPALHTLWVHKHVPIVYYTHIENMVFFDSDRNDTFLDSFNQQVTNWFTLEGVTVGTQTEQNRKNILAKYPKARVLSLPMFVPEQELLKNKETKREGVLFIGRHEQRKNPTLFIKTLVDIKKKYGVELLAKVMTRGTHKEKWEEAFAEAGLKNYILKFDIIGKEKVDFIQSAKVAFHPSLRESFGFSAFETLHSCRTILIEEFAWWENFKDWPNLTVSTKEKVVDDVFTLYNLDAYDAEEINKYSKKVYDNTRLEWGMFFEGIFMQEILNESANTYMGRKNQLTELMDNNDQIKVSEYYANGFRQDLFDKLMQTSKKKYKIFNKKGYTILSNKDAIRYENNNSITDLFS